MSGIKTLGHLATELQRRVTQLSVADAEAAINDAISWLWRQGSYTFQFTGVDTIVPTTLSVGAGDTLGQGTAPLTCDMGKAMFLANSPQGTPIEKQGMQELSLPFALNIPANKGFSTYYISGRTFLFRPSQTAQNVGIRYHKLFQVYGATDFPVTPEDADDPIVSWAEARERRVYDVGDSWPKVQADAEKEIMLILNAYRSISQEPMAIGEAVVASEERTKLGHA